MQIVRPGNDPRRDLIEQMKAEWLARPVNDIEQCSQLTEAEAEELAAWHHEQIVERARILGCSPLMAGIVEELCRCWLDGTPPHSPHARRVLKAYE